MTTSEFVCGTGEWVGPKPGDPDNNIVLNATGTFGGIDVSWSYPTTNPYAVAHTVLYRGLTDNFAGAVQHTIVAGNYFFDKFGGDEPVVYYYWVQMVSVNGTYASIVGPATATARPSIEDTIRQLSGKIDQGALAQELRSNIDHIGLLDNTISGEIRDRIAANQALGVALNGVQSDVDSAITLIETEVSERINANSALLTSLNLMGVGFQNSVAGLTEEVELVATANTALASKINTVEATVNGDTATGQVGLTAKVNAVTGAVESMYTAKVGVNGLIGGFGLYNDGTVVEAGFDVDRFWVGKGDSTIKPFIIENGEVFINRAVIQTLTADMIDTRGLLIRDTPDNGGGIIFGAGNALDWKTGVSGSGKPADGATAGAPAGTYVGSTLAQDVESQNGAQAKADAAQTAAIAAAATDTTNKVASKLDKASTSVLNIDTSSAVRMAGIRVGNLDWDSSGNRTSGKGLALTPQGIVAHNGTETTFTVDATTGDVYAKGELIVPDASITTAKIGELSVDGLRIKGGAVTYTAMQTMTNTWTETTEKVIGFIDFSSMSSEGIFLKVMIEPTVVSPYNFIGELDYSKIQVSSDGTTWFNLEVKNKIAHQVCDYNSEVSSCWIEYDLATVPFGQRICTLNPSRFAHAPYNEYYYWKGTTEVATMLTKYHVWAIPVTNPGVLEFGIRIPTAGTYELTYCADDYVDAGSNTFFSISGSTTSLAGYTYPNAPNKHTFTTTVASTYAGLKVSARNASGWYGFAAYIKDTATGEIVWHSRRVNEYPDILRYVRVVAKKYGSSVPNINAWLGVEIVRK